MLEHIGIKKKIKVSNIFGILNFKGILIAIVFKIMFFCD